MLTEETRPDGAGENSRPIDVTTLGRQSRIQHLINRVNAHEAEAAEIAAEMKALSLTPGQVKKIQATQRTLAALMGSDLLPEGAQL